MKELEKKEMRIILASASPRRRELGKSDKWYIKNNAVDILKLK